MEQEQELLSATPALWSRSWKQPTGAVVLSRSCQGPVGGVSVIARSYKARSYSEEL